MPSIIFIDVDFKDINPTQNDPMVITTKAKNLAIMKTLVDQGSSIDILYWKTFKKL